MMKLYNSVYKLLCKTYVASSSITRCSHIWTSNSIRSSFLSFFEEKDHSFIPSSPVVPWNDTSLEFVNAGMNQFKSSLVGAKPFPAKRVVNSQKCIRVGGKHNDLLDVGRDTYHHTFFEMLGNWSFDDYFKEGACRMSWEFLTQVLRIPPEHLYVSYFGGEASLGLQPDEEVKDIWLSIGVPKERVLPFDLKDNFWEMGNVGPCGPSTEIHFERVPSRTGASKLNSGSEELIEIWNLVFIQYQRLITGDLVPLKSQFVDTGMGLERLTACLNDKWSNYDTDLFLPLFDAIQKISGKPCYGGRFGDSGDCLDTGYRVLADHSRMIAISLADGILPHDSYALRKAIRRSLMIGREQFGLSSTQDLMSTLLHRVTLSLGDTYPELVTHLGRSKSLLKYEEEQLLEVQAQVSKDWPKLVQAHPQLSTLTSVFPKLVEGLKNLLPNTSKWPDKTFPMDEALKLSENYFLPLEVIADVAEVLGFHLDESRLQEKIRNNKKADTNKEKFKKTSFKQEHLALNEKTDNSAKYDYFYTPRKKYSYAEHTTAISSIIKDGELADQIKKGESAILVLKSSNFYPKSGGQMSDYGSISCGEENFFKISKVENVENYILHFGDVSSGSFETGNEVWLKVNQGPRMAASKLHTAHHLLRAAIQAVAGMAFQRASKVTDKQLTLDVFVHPPLRLHQLRHAENIVKAWIAQEEPVSIETTSIFEALSAGNVTLVSGEKYPEDVRVIRSICQLPPDLVLESPEDQDGPVTSVTSSELCCGTHVFNAGDLGHFALTEFKNLGKGVARISGVLGKGASKLNAHGETVSQKFNAWETKIESVLQKGERLMELNKDFKKWRTTVHKSKLPITVFDFIEGRSNQLVERMQEVLSQKSNWEELQVEFRDHLSKHPDGLIIYGMETEYRGPMESLENIMREVSGRPAVFVCKGWGRVRACIYIPKEFQKEESILGNLLEELQVTLGGVTKKEENFEGICTFHMNGVKREKLVSIQSEILKISLKWMSK